MKSNILLQIIRDVIIVATLFIIQRLFNCYVYQGGCYNDTYCGEYGHERENES